MNWFVLPHDGITIFMNMYPINTLKLNIDLFAKQIYSDYLLLLMTSCNTISSISISASQSIAMNQLLSMHFLKVCTLDIYLNSTNVFRYIYLTTHFFRNKYGISTFVLVYFLNVPKQ